MYRNGELVEENTDVSHVWDENMVIFLIGCSFTSEEALIKNGSPTRHNEEICNSEFKKFPQRFKDYKKTHATVILKNQPHAVFYNQFG